jgi:hypothetical protein
MEKLNLNFSGGDNVVKSICWIMSYLSWLLLVASGWASIKWLDEKPYYEEDNPNPDDIHAGWTIWAFKVLRTGKNDKDPLKEGYYPLQMQVSLYYICFILTLIVITGGCFVFFYKTICKKDDQVINGMMGQFSKFHFFPLLCASALFITGECVDNLDKEDWLTEKREDHFKNMYISGLVFSIVGLASFIFIYIMTDLNTDWWVLILLKKGAFSCLIILMWYSFCYDIFYVHFYDKQGDEDDDPFGDTSEMSKKMWDWKKGCGLAFSIIFGVGSLAFSFVFKDLVACVMNLLIYIGLTVAYFRLPSEFRKEKEFNKNGDGIVDIIMLVLSVAVIVLLLIKYRENCLKS